VKYCYDAIKASRTASSQPSSDGNGPTIYRYRKFHFHLRGRPNGDEMGWISEVRVRLGSPGNHQPNMYEAASRSESTNTPMQAAD
jgi:hypothetical protein